MASGSAVGGIEVGGSWACSAVRLGSSSRRYTFCGGGSLGGGTYAFLLGGGGTKGFLMNPLAPEPPPPGLNGAIGAAAALLNIAILSLKEPTSGFSAT